MVRLSRPGACVRVRVTPVCALALARGSGLCREQGARMRPTPPGHLPRKSSPLTVGSVRAMARICRATPDRADRSDARRVVDPQPRQALGRRGRRGAGRRPPRLHRRSPVSRRQAHRRRLAKFRVACEARISHLKRRYGRSRHGSAVTHGTLPSDPPTASPSASGSSPGANLQPGPRHPARPCSSFSAPDSSGGK